MLGRRPAYFDQTDIVCLEATASPKSLPALDIWIRYVPIHHMLQKTPLYFPGTRLKIFNLFAPRKSPWRDTYSKMQFLDAGVVVPTRTFASTLYGFTRIISSCYGAMALQLLSTPLFNKLVDAIQLQGATAERLSSSALERLSSSDLESDNKRGQHN